VLPIPTAHAQITVDGDPGDWVADASGQTVNTGQYYACGEFVWVDAEDDDTGDGDYTYPGFCGILVTIHVDQDGVEGSGQEWAAQSMDAKFAPSLWWEYSIILHGFGPWIMDSSWNTVAWVGNGMEVMGSEEHNCIEVAVDHSVLGDPAGASWVFTVQVGLEEYSNFREVTDTQGGWTPGGGVPAGDNDWVECDAFDAAFYSSATAQAQDWNDYDQATGTPTVLGNTGEGFKHICFAPPATISPEPLSYTAKRINETFSLNATIDSLSAECRVIGIQFRLTYNSTLLQLVDVTEGSFMNQFGDTFFMVMDYPDDPLYGSHVAIGILLLPNELGQWEAFPEGGGVLATVTFKVVYQHVGLENPPLSCNLTLIDTMIIDEELATIAHETQGSHYQVLPNNIADINWDYKVNMKDLGLAALAFGTSPGDERWNPAADIIKDDKINMRDLALIARNFGWEQDP